MNRAGHQQRRRRGTRRTFRGSRIESLEDRRLLTGTLASDSVENLRGLDLTTEPGLPTPQEVATFGSTDPGAVAADFTAMIDWGDGTPATAGTVKAATGGGFEVIGTHAYTSDGTYTPVITITDPSGITYATGSYYQTNLVSSVPTLAAQQDPNLLGPMGLTSTQSATVADAADLWVTDTSNAVTTLYTPTESPITQSTVITMPTRQIGGITANVDNQGFDVPGTSDPATLLFDDTSGTIDAWDSGASATTAATVAGAEFTGLAQGYVESGSTPNFYIYAADFSNRTGANGIDVFDASFNDVSDTAFAGKFADPDVPPGFVPFNIVDLGGNLYVSYVDVPGTEGPVPVPGGYIAEFDTSGDFIKTIYSDRTGQDLNGPYGMVLSGPDDLWVANYAGGPYGTTGTISIINLSNDTYAGTVDWPDGTPIADGGLFSLANGVTGSAVISSDSVYFTAALDSDTEGLLGAITLAPSGSVTVGSLSPSPTQPIVSTAYGETFSGSVASFADANAYAGPSDFTALIDWGDGTQTVGTVTQPGGAGTAFVVSGTHAYSGDVGPETITVSIDAANGEPLTIASIAEVADVAPTIAGGLASTSETGTGAAVADEITNLAEPDFDGTSNQPGTTISLYAQESGSSAWTFIGAGTAAANGAWSIAATEPLVDESYAIAAQIAAPSGGTIGGMTTIVPDLVVDTVGPKVIGETVDRSTGRITLTFQDDDGLGLPGTGVTPSSLTDSANYLIVAMNRHQTVKGRLKVVSTTDGAAPGTEIVTLQTRGRRPIVGGGLALEVIAAGASDSSGIRDIAGNPLIGGDDVVPLARGKSLARIARRR